jgi:hypothetical protein
MVVEKKLGVWYILSIIINIITVVMIFFYMISVTRLNFLRSRALTYSDFNYQTDDYTSAKYVFITLIPLFLLSLVPMALFVRLIVSASLNTIGVRGRKDDPIKLSFDQQEDVSDNQKGVRFAHGVISILALIAMLASFILLCIDLSDCNNKLNGPNLCSDQRYCCATDVYSSLTKISLRCPYILSCSGISPPISSKELQTDPYFLWTFIVTIMNIVFLFVHLWIAFGLNFNEFGDKDEEEEEELMEQQLLEQTTRIRKKIREEDNDSLFGVVKQS